MKARTSIVTGLTLFVLAAPAAQASFPSDHEGITQSPRHAALTQGRAYQKRVVPRTARTFRHSTRNALAGNPRFYAVSRNAI